MIDKYLEGLNFFEIILVGSGVFDYNEITVATYRPKEAIYEAFNKDKNKKCSVHDIALKDIKSSGVEWFPIFCVELRSDYQSLEELAKDIMVWRLSGMMDKEMVGMENYKKAENYER